MIRGNSSAPSQTAPPLTAARHPPLTQGATGFSTAPAAPPRHPHPQQLQPSRRSPAACFVAEGCSRCSPSDRPATEAPPARQQGFVVTTPALVRPGETTVPASDAHVLGSLQKPSAGGVEALIRAGYPAKDPGAAPPTYHVVTPSCADPGEYSFAVQLLAGW